MKIIRQRLPELCLIAAALFFVLRELATFPASWEDSGLYTMVAKSLANGDGYALPIIDHEWKFPYFLSVGPTVIVPVAICIRLFGFGLAVARIPSVIYLLGATLLFFIYVLRISNRTAARWATALLISFSAFVNTGKPVQGSVPAFFFLLLGLLCLHQATEKRRMFVLAGICIGLSILTKLTFVLTLPALCLGVAAYVFMMRSVPRGTTLALLFAIGIPALWLTLELLHQEGFLTFLQVAISRSSNGDIATALQNKLPLLLRFQYLYFLGLLALAWVGLRNGNFRLNILERTFIASTFLLFFAHFLIREGWYRHLLLAHLLLLFFVPAGAFSLLGRKWGTAVLALFVGMQGLWQLDHRGSSRSLAAAEAAAFIETSLAEQNVLIQHSEIFVRLSENPRWLYYPIGGTAELIPTDITDLSPAQRCLPFIRKLNDEELIRYAERMYQISGSYHLIFYPDGCPPVRIESLSP